MAQKTEIASKMKTTLEMKMTLKFKTSPKMKTAQKMKKILKGKMTLNLDTNEWQLAGGTVKGYFSPWAQQSLPILGSEHTW